MLEYNVQRATQAVQYLVEYEYASAKIKKLRSCVKRARVMPFKGDEEMLNELLVVGRQSEDAMEKMISIVLYKRKSQNAKQASFMSTKRWRFKMVIGAYEAITNEKLTIEQAQEKLVEASERWNLERDQHVALCKLEYARSFRTAAGWQQKNKFIKDYWETLQMTLQQAFDEATKIKQQRAANQQTMVVVKKPIDSLAQKKRVQDELDKLKN